MDFSQFRKKKVFLRGRGGSDEQHKADEVLYHELLSRHAEIERVTTAIENGIHTTTRITSGDEKLVRILQEHVLGMKKRYDGGRAVRSWDMLFVELFDHREAIKMQWKMLKNGIRVSLTSDDPNVVEIIHRHDETLTAFVHYGFQASKHQSPYRPSEHDD